MKRESSLEEEPTHKFELMTPPFLPHTQKFDMKKI